LSYSVAFRNFELLVSMIPRLCENNSSGPFDVVTVPVDLEALLQSFRAYFDTHPDQMGVLISDALFPVDSGRVNTELVTQCQAHFAKFAFGTIATMPHSRRLPDIDRTIDEACSSDILATTIRLVIARLQYLARPTRPFQLDNRFVTVRPLKTNNETERRDYFSLRHNVDKTMGYLESSVEETRSGLEVNEADVHAVHIGAFWHNGEQGQLVGTARVVTTADADTTLQSVLEGMLRNDDVVPAKAGDS